jgi:nitrate/nitrite transporter NarK
LLALLLNGWSSDRFGERRWHTAVCLFSITVGLALSVVQHQVALALAMFCLASAGMYGYLASFWSIPPTLLGGTALATAVGMINSIGNLGGFAGPYLVGYLTRVQHSFTPGILYLSTCAAMSALLVIAVRPRTAAAQVTGPAALATGAFRRNSTS